MTSLKQPLNTKITFLSISSLPWLGLLALYMHGETTISAAMVYAIAAMSLLLPLLYALLRRQHDIAPALTGAACLACAVGGVTLQVQKLVGAELDAAAKLQHQAIVESRIPQDG